MFSKIESIKTKLVSKMQELYEGSKVAISNAGSAIKTYVNQMKAPGVYSDTRAQDTLEWIAMATVIIVVIAIFAAVIRAIVANRSQQIDSSWPA